MFLVNKNDQPKLTTLLEYPPNSLKHATCMFCKLSLIIIFDMRLILSLLHLWGRDFSAFIVWYCNTDKRDMFFRGNKCVKAYFHYFGYVFISLKKASPQNLSHFWQSISAFLLCCTIKPGQAPTTTRFHPHPHSHSLHITPSWVISHSDTAFNAPYMSFKAFSHF